MLRVRADIDRLEEVFEYIRGVLKEDPDAGDCLMAAELCADEIFTNIASYAYPNEEGKEALIDAVLDKEKRSFTMSFIDEGEPFNPLDKEDPDTSLPAEERQVGGLGIFLVKQYMDYVNYERKDGENILTVKKKY